MNMKQTKPSWLIELYNKNGIVNKFGNPAIKIATMFWADSEEEAIEQAKQFDKTMPDIYKINGVRREL